MTYLNPTYNFPWLRIECKIAKELLLGKIIITRCEDFEKYLQLFKPQTSKNKLLTVKQKFQMSIEIFKLYL